MSYALKDTDKRASTHWGGITTYCGVVLPKLHGGTCVIEKFADGREEWRVHMPPHPKLVIKEGTLEERLAQLRLLAP